MPRAGQTKPPVAPRLSDRIAIGVLTTTFPPELVDRVIAKTGRAEQRQRLLPARVVVYSTLAMCLFAQVGYEEVMRLLVEGLAWLRRFEGTWQVPAWPGAAAGAVRRGRPPAGDPGDQGRVVSRLATGGVGWHHPGRGRHAGQRGGVRSAWWGPGPGGVPAGAAGRADRVWHARDRGRGHGRAASWGELAGAVAGALAGTGDAAAGRSGPVRPGAVADLPGHRGGAGVALPPGREAAGAGGLRRRVLAQRVGRWPSQAQAGGGAGGRLPPGRPRPPWPAGGLPAADHDRRP